MKPLQKLSHTPAARRYTLRLKNGCYHRRLIAETTQIQDPEFCIIGENHITPLLKVEPLFTRLCYCLLFRNRNPYRATLNACKTPTVSVNGNAMVKERITLVAKHKLNGNFFVRYCTAHNSRRNSK